MAIQFINQMLAALIKAKIFDQILDFEYIICGYLITPSQYACFSAPNFRKIVIVPFFFHIGQTESAQQPTAR